MTVDIEVGDRLVVRFTGWDRVWALSAGIAVPITSVTGVRTVPRSRAAELASGFRLPGTFWPGLIQAGSYLSRERGWSLWCVHRAQEVLLVDLVGERYSHLVLETPDVHAASRTIARHRFR